MCLLYEHLEELGEEEIVEAVRSKSPGRAATPPVARPRAAASA